MPEAARHRRRVGQRGTCTRVPETVSRVRFAHGF